MPTREEREVIVKTTQLAGKYSRESPRMVATLITTLFATAKKIRRLATIGMNNRNLTDAEEQRLKEYRGTFRKTALRLGATGVPSGDIRGYLSKVTWPGGESNDWSGNEWGID